MKPYPKDLIILCASLSVVVAGLMAYTLFGEPAYGFYGPMKLAVLGASVVCSWGLFRLSAWFSLLSVVLLGCGLIEAFAKFRRDEWEPYNWVTLVAFVLATIFFGVVGARALTQEDK